MRTIINMQKRGYLSEMQVMAAFRFSRAPNQFQLAPSLFRVLHDVVIAEKTLTEVETEKGWPVRSAKQIVSLLLHALVECRGDQVRGGIDSASVENMEHRISVLTGNDPSGQMEVMRKFAFTAQQARIWLIIMAAPNREITKDILIARLEGERHDDLLTEENLKVQVCKMRAKIQGSCWSIETVWGVGYRIVVKALNDPKLVDAIDCYVAHVIGGVSMRQLARQKGVEASTVLRRIRKIEDLRDEPGFDQIIDRAEAKAANPPQATRSPAE